MTKRAPRTSGDDVVDAAIRGLLDAIGPGANRHLVAECLTTVALLAREDHDKLDLKITSAALAEMRLAFGVFRPYRAKHKITMFGSARTRPDDPQYEQARACAARIAQAGWMVVTGAGPGIMAAGMEGAGLELSMGVNIRLPFEQSANAFIERDPKLVTMKYFFTRKLMLIKESDGYVVLPGGFGTLDESFELLTLLQTGKAEPAPVVLLDVPGGTYFEGWSRFVEEEVVGRNLVGAVDLSLYRVTDSVEEAAEEILGFYRSYSSLRYVGNRLVLRVKVEPTPDEVDGLDAAFSDICVPDLGGFELVAPTPDEVAEADSLHLHRIAFPFDRLQNGRLRQLIDHLNRLPSVLAAGS
ncbi:MAG: LOG family protein [Acidimicrobiales bacterium]